ncbi:MAG: hypothetical protein V2I39_13365 [Erythrobacter sp.]|jgi:hypothetical protein|nr:hypothetical protein [Erythrobacter sp.]
MSWLFETGHAADLILAVLAIEALWLRRGGWSWRALAGLLGPAALLVLGLRGALIGAAWPLVAFPLALSLPLHLLDLRQRSSGGR